MDAIKTNKFSINQIAKYIKCANGVSPDFNGLGPGKIDQVDVPSMSDVVIPLLVEYITSTGLQPGDKLPPEKALEKIIGVSNPPLREALSILRSVGIVKSKAGKGWFVGKFDPTYSLRYLVPLLEKVDELSLDQINDYRLAVEPVVARYAAQNITEEGIQCLQSTHQFMLEKLDEGSKDEFRKSDRHFHEILAQECHHPIMAMLSSITIGLFPHLYMQKTINYGRVLEQHKKILDGMIAHDPVLAENAMIDHIVKSYEFLKTVFGKET